VIRDTGLGIGVQLVPAEGGATNGHSDDHGRIACHDTLRVGRAARISNHSVEAHDQIGVGNLSGLSYRDVDLPAGRGYLMADRSRHRTSNAVHHRSANRPRRDRTT
jgi:hypothetical protein